MATHIVPTESPVLRELNIRRSELESLEVELSQHELDLATLRGSLLAFERRYLRIVGIHQAELDEIEAQLWELLVRFTPEDGDTIEQAKQARAQARESSETFGTLPEIPDAIERFQPSSDLKQYYRDIAKLIHPDLAADEKERALRTILMAEANVAYQCGDEELLRKIFLRWKQNPQNHQSEDPGYYLEQILCRIRHAKERLTFLQSELATLENTELYRLMLQVEESAARGIDLLAAMAKHLEQQVSKFKTRLNEMICTVSE